MIEKYMHLLDGITKERLIVQRLLNLFGEHSMIMLIGPRKVGKTTALLQLASKLNKNSVYIDCGDVEDQRLLSKIKMDISAGSEEYNDSYIFIDEIQELKYPENTVIDFANKTGMNPSIHVIITGSETAFTDLLARGKGGGGRSKYIYMPILTYIEYLYLTGKIDSYQADLLNVQYGTTFMDYMRLKDLPQFKVGHIDANFLISSINDMAKAGGNTRISTDILNVDADDIKRAFLLLSYRLAFDLGGNDIGFKGIFQDILVGNHEIGEDLSDFLIESNKFDSYSVLVAARATMSNEQIAKAVRYLLWHGLVVFNYTVFDYDTTMPINLMALYTGHDYALQGDYIKNLFTENNSIYVVNPLLYSAISSEFWALLEDMLKPGKRSRQLLALLHLLKSKIANNPEGDFLRSKPILGPWVESYLRGSFAIMEGGLPFITRKFIGGKETLSMGEKYEVDIVGRNRSVLMEITVRETDKKEKEVHFDLLRSGSEPCILTTNKSFGVVQMKNIPVMKIPYPMLAAFLDRGELPELEDVSKEEIRRKTDYAQKRQERKENYLNSVNNASVDSKTQNYSRVRERRDMRITGHWQNKKKTTKTVVNS